VTRTRVVVPGVVGVAIVAGLALALLRDVSPAGVDFAGDLRRGGTIERLTLPSLEGEGVFGYASVADRPLVINFFASWCPPCIAEMPDFERVHQQVRDQVTFLGVSQSDPREASLQLADQTGITYETAIDQDGRFFNALGAQGMPTTVFVRPGGEIADVWVGALDEASLARLVEEHFGGEGVVPAAFGGSSPRA
jgi:thiol-disulfide isomerase/thioredoxin